MNREEFNRAAVEKFGDKVHTEVIEAWWANEQIVGRHEEGKREGRAFGPAPTVTQEELDEYGEWTWATGGACPVCGRSLSLYFKWGLVHGYGNCTCGAEFKALHHVTERAAIIAFALTGW